jgi:hypothetical protein
MKKVKCMNTALGAIFIIHNFLMNVHMDPNKLEYLSLANFS